MTTATRSLSSFSGFACLVMLALCIGACGDLKIKAPLTIDAGAGDKDASAELDASQPQKDAAVAIPAVKPTALAPTMGTSKGGVLVAITGSGFVPGLVVTFDGSPARDITVHSPTIITATTPPHAPGKVSVAVVGDQIIKLKQTYEYVNVASVDGPPRLVSAVSTSNTTVRVTFTEPVKLGADDASNYNIVRSSTSSTSGVLLVRTATLGKTGITVDLKTASQNEVTYQLSATNISDLDGNLLAPPQLLVNPTVVQFAGTPPSAGDGTLVDSDGDLLSDSSEQNGWTVSVTLANGDIVESSHTSDPMQADTDDDGLDDATELSIGTNPRSGDTDGDSLGDAEEYNDWYSDPTKQDSDDDGVTDGLEIFFQTSPVLDDSDGDGVSDNDELFLLNRDPLIANLPLPQIVVQSFKLDLSVTSSFTDENGMTHAVTSAETSQFAQSRSDSAGRSDTRSTETTNQSSQEIGAEVSYSTDKGFGGKVTAKAGFEQSSARGFSTAVSTDTARTAQQGYENSTSQALEASESRAVTRNIDAASIKANINIANQSDVPFTIKNLQISVQQQDRAGDGSFQPLATLKPSGDDVSFNLGPFDPERGPVIFENTDIFPNLIDDLLREPTGLIFKVANYDVLDEDGRNFAFSAATIKNRTAGLTIDYGDGTVENYRIATHSKFDENGRSLGISMQRALEIAGLAVMADDVPVASPVTDDERNSYGTLTDTTGAERLVRVRGVQNDLSGNPNPEKRFWAVQTNNVGVSPDANFSEIVLHSGDEYLLFFTRDLDQDGLHEREENLYGSLDDKTDTDGDGLLDYDEVRTGWTVSVVPGAPRKVFPSPARPDSDLDGLSDAAEKASLTDPNRADSDGDAIKDNDELNSSLFITLFDGDNDDSNNPLLVVDPYTDSVVIDGGNLVCNTQASGDDVQVVAVGSAVAGGDVVISAGPNGVIDSAVSQDDFVAVTENIAAGVNGRCNTKATGDDIQVLAVNAVASGPFAVCVRPGLDGQLGTTPASDDFIRAPHAGLFTTSPLMADTDFDGVPDGRELVVGTNPNSKDTGKVTDTDGDGLFDSEEDTGWVVNGKVVKSNKLVADTDRDGLLDVFEWAIRSNPQSVDTDGDTLRDGDEFDPDDTDGYYTAGSLITARSRCTAASNCKPAAAPALASRLRTNVLSKDSDKDTLSDDFEINASKPNSQAWVVRVVGQNPYSAAPKPWSKDFDLDGYDDSQEFALLTDPNIGDTDADGTTDKAEVDARSGGNANLRRNPLEPDQLVWISYDTFVVNDNCQDVDGVGDYYGHLFISGPGSLQEQVYDCEDCCKPAASNNGIGSCPLGIGRAFRLIAGQNITINTDDFQERNGILAATSAGSFTDKFDYPVTPTINTRINNSGGQGNCVNSLSVDYTLTVN